MCFVYLNQFNDAEKYYSRCFFLKPDDIIFLNNLSNIYLKQKKFELALPLLKKSLEKNQDQIRVINLTVMCLIDLNKREEAEKFSNDKLKFFSDNRLLNKLHGRNLIYLNKHKQGLNFLKKGTGFLELEGKNIRILSY